MQKLFSKTDKKVLIILIVVLVVILLLGFAIYKYVAGSVDRVRNSVGGVETEQKSNNTPQVQIQAGGVQVQGESGGGMLSVCLDKCGDGICQEADLSCGESNNLNCICPETQQECPQDCK